MHAIILPVVWALISQLGPASDRETSALGPVPEVYDEVPVEGFQRPSFSVQRTRMAPPVSLEPPAQLRERSPVARAGFEEPETRGSSGDRAAAIVLQQGLSPHVDRGSESAPLSLLEALRTSGDRPRQLATVRCYWRTTVRLAESHWANKQTALLASLAHPHSPHDQSLLAAVRDAASAQEIDAELSAMTAQEELAEMVYWPAQRPPLRPTDTPLVTLYKTNFESIFAQRAAPAKVARLARMLPIQQRLVVARAKSVQSAEAVVQETIDEYDSGKSTLSQVLQAIRQLSAERIDFLDSVRDYNQSISEYSLAVVSSSASNETLVATLVHVPTKTYTATQQPITDGRARRAPAPTSRMPESPRTTDIRAPASRVPESRVPESRAPESRPPLTRVPKADHEQMRFQESPRLGARDNLPSRNAARVFDRERASEPRAVNPPDRELDADEPADENRNWSRDQASGEEHEPETDAAQEQFEQPATPPSRFRLPARRLHGAGADSRYDVSDRQEAAKDESAVESVEEPTASEDASAAELAPVKEVDRPAKNATFPRPSDRTRFGSSPQTENKDSSGTTNRVLPDLSRPKRSP